MPGTLQFLANSQDPADPLTVYGAGHVTTFDSEDDPYVKALLLEGKASLLSIEDAAAVKAAAADQAKAFKDANPDWKGL